MDVVAEYDFYYEIYGFVMNTTSDDFENNPGFYTTIRIRKDAVVNYYDGSRYSLTEYANLYSSDKIHSFKFARMGGVIQDTQGYVIRFTDHPAG